MKQMSRVIGIMQRDGDAKGLAQRASCVNYGILVVLTFGDTIGMNLEPGIACRGELLDRGRMTRELHYLLSSYLNQRY